MFIYPKESGSPAGGREQDIDHYSRGGSEALREQGQPEVGRSPFVASSAEKNVISA